MTAAAAEAAAVMAEVEAAAAPEATAALAAAIVVWNQRECRSEPQVQRSPVAGPQCYRPALAATATAKRTDRCSFHMLWRRTCAEPGLRPGAYVCCYPTAEVNVGNLAAGLDVPGYRPRSSSLRGEKKRRGPD